MPQTTEIAECLVYRLDDTHAMICCPSNLTQAAKMLAVARAIPAPDDSYGWREADYESEGEMSFDDEDFPDCCPSDMDNRMHYMFILER